MAWFARSQTDDTHALLLDALDDVLSHLSDQAEPPPRLVRLRERLQRPPVPTGLRRELAAVLSQLPEPGADDDLDDAPTRMSEMARALVDALGAAALLDAEVATGVDALSGRVPARIGVGDARMLTREAEELRAVALPARARAEQSRREVHRLVSDLSSTLSPSLRNAASLDWGIGELSARLASAHEPETLGSLRVELMKLARDLSGTSGSMRKQLATAMEHVRALEDALSEASQQLEDVRAASERDALTGLLDRGGFERRLIDAMEARGGDRDGEGLCLVLVDIDHFKQVNDTWGHPVGDEILCRVADHLQREVRTSDVVGRVGGEEFGVVLIDADLEAARQIVERIRVAVESDVHDCDGDLLHVTISSGVASMESEESFSALYKRADAALYQAKAGGRNRSVLAA